MQGSVGGRRLADDRNIERIAVGFANSRGGLVFVDESAEELAAVHAWRCCCLLERDRSVGREQVERAVGSVLVVVPTVDAENVFEVSAAEDEEPVETIGADGAHPAFGVGVRVWPWGSRTRSGEVRGLLRRR